MVVRVGVGDAESDRYFIQEGRVSVFSEVLTYEKDDLVLSTFELRLCQEGLIGTAIVVGADGFDDVTFAIFIEAGEFYLHAGGRFAVGGIEDVGG